MVTGTKDGDSVCKLAAAQSLQMRILKAKVSQIQDDQIYRFTRAELEEALSAVARQVLAEVFAN